MVSYTWAKGTGGNWTSAANWAPALVPNDSAADVTIDAAPIAGPYVVTIATGESVTVNSLTTNGVTNLLGSNTNPYNAAQLEIDGTLTFAAGSAGRMGGSLQTYVVISNGTIVNPGTVDGFLQCVGNVLMTGTNGFYCTAWTQALGGTVTIDTKSIAEFTGTTLFDGIFEAKGPGAVVNLGGPLQHLIVNIATVTGPPLIPEGWTELLLDDPNAKIQEWNGSGYVQLESTLRDIGNRATLDVLGRRNYVTSNKLAIETGGMLNLQAGIVTTAEIDINGGVVQGFATITNGVVNNSTLMVVGGTLALAAALSGTGVVDFDLDLQTGKRAATGGTLELHSVTAGQTINMHSSDTLILDTPATFAGQISGGVGDKIVLRGITATSAAINGGTLVVYNGTNVVDTLRLTGAAGDSVLVNGSTLTIAGSDSHFTVLDTTTRAASTSAGAAYSGPVAGLQWEYINITTDSLNITSTVPNAFLRSGSGMDGLNVSQANGNNVLDGSTGSNFLTGGTGNDTFYMDDRNPTAPVFSTIVNFHAGDNATVWGVNASDFTMLKLDNQGAAGFTGLDLIFTAPGHIDTSFVLAGYTSADLTNGRLSMSYGKTADLPGLPGSQYLTVHAN